MKTEKNFLVIDCESIGLYGESFAVGFVLIGRKGNKLNEGLYSVNPDYVCGLSSNIEWVKSNVALENSLTFDNLHGLKEYFWNYWASLDNTLMAADCLFPVEALFLSDCVKNDQYNRQWDAPYPFIDISTLFMACGKSPTQVYERLKEELPAHNPLMDARQSARLMIECFDQLKILN